MSVDRGCNVVSTPDGRVSTPDDPLSALNGRVSSAGKHIFVTGSASALTELVAE